MKHVLTVLILISIVLGTWQTARADAPKDLAWVRSELSKPANMQKGELVDSTLQKLVNAPASLAPQDYRDARLLAAERAIAASKGLTEPEKRARMNKVLLDVSAVLGKVHLPAGLTDPRRHMEIRRTQLDLIGRVTDQSQASAARAAVGQDVVKSLQATCGETAPADADVKAAALREGLDLLRYIPDEAQRRRAQLLISGMLIDTGTPATREFYNERARLRLQAGDIAGAAADFEALSTDPIATESQRIGAHLSRMDLLVSRGQAPKAAADMLALVALDVHKGVWDFRRSCDARRRAADNALAIGAMTWEAYRRHVESLVPAVLAEPRLSAEERSNVLTDLLLSAADQAALQGRVGEALSLARAAYDIAPNGHVARTVLTVETLLANRSYKPMAPGTFNVHYNPADAELAQAFHARQAGEKTVPLTEEELVAARKAYQDALAAAAPDQRSALERRPIATVRVVKLRADRPDDAEFPRQLIDVKGPFNEATVSAIQARTTSAADPMTAALALGLIGKHDEALATMARQVNAAGIDRAKVTDALNFTARFVRAKFESVALANAFLASQSYGPAGRDGKAGTDDDTPNPLTAK